MPVEVVLVEELVEDEAEEVDEVEVVAALPSVILK